MCRRGCKAGCSLFWCFIFLFLGIITVGVGIWYPVDPFVFDTKVMEDPTVVRDGVRWQGFVGGLLAVGAFCVLVGILGMIASGCESKGAIIAFMVFGSLGCIACIVISGLATASFATGRSKYGGDGRSELVDLYADNLANNYANENGTDHFTKAWNRYQSKLSCCGMRNFSDYENGVFYNNTGFEAPWSCCKMRASLSWNEEATPADVEDLEACRLEAAVPPSDGVYDFLNNQGCEEDVEFRYKFNDIMILGIDWGVVFFQIVTLIVSGCLKEDLKVSNYVV